jgi:hypothetical protein
MLGLVLVAGCGCMDVALNRVTPEEASIRVGESIMLVYESGGGCHSGNAIVDVHYDVTPTIWRTVDTLIVTLDTLSGRVTGRNPGDARIVSGGGSGSVVHVRP